MLAIEYKLRDILMFFTHEAIKGSTKMRIKYPNLSLLVPFFSDHRTLYDRICM